MLTLFACFVLNFSNIFCDCVLEARAAMFAVFVGVRRGFEESDVRGNPLFPFLEDAMRGGIYVEGRNLAESPTFI
jgi:hypothetical protein